MKFGYLMYENCYIVTSNGNRKEGSYDCCYKRQDGKIVHRFFENLTQKMFSVLDEDIEKIEKPRW